jgi:putative heme-binding domain-containing protein
VAAAVMLAGGALSAAPPDDNPLLVAPSDPIPAKEQQKKFHLPPGFEIQLVAEEPDVPKPMNLAFDSQGRLWVTQSVEYPFPAPGDRPARDTVRILSQFAEDGRARRVETWTDGLNIPIGVTPIGREALVYGIPNLYLTSDRDGDGKSAERRVLFGPFGYNDTHGMISSLVDWIDGWVYACHGFANTSEVVSPDGTRFSMNSGNTWRFRPDGSRAEQWTHGQVNPFGLCFDPLGNLYSSDCHSMPAYQLLEGAFYPSFGKPHDGLGFGPVMLTHDHGSTGIAGIVYYAAEQFPPERRHTLFIGNPVTGRINHDRLDRRGSTLWAVEQPDFLTCDDPWFRPVDLELGPDGALYVADFYNKIIGHYEVPLTHPGRDHDRGRIWRIVYRPPGGAAPPSPESMDLANADVAGQVAALDNSNLAVRVLATNVLARLGDEPSLAALQDAVEATGTPFQRAHGLWVLFRRGALGTPLLKRLVEDQSPLVRVHAVKAAAEMGEWKAGEGIAEVVLARLSDEEAFVVRAAALALGRHPAAGQVEPLCSLWQRAPEEDTHLIHAVRMAIRDHLATAEGIAEARRLAEVPEVALRLAETCLGVRDERSAVMILDMLENAPTPPQRRDEFVEYAARWLPAADGPRLEAWAMRQSNTPAGSQLTLLEAWRRGRESRGLATTNLMARWALPLARMLLSADAEEQRRAGLLLARSWRFAELFDPARILSLDGKSSMDCRVEAMQTCLALDAPQSVDVLASVLNGPVESTPLRQRAADLLGSANSDRSRQALVEALKSAPQRVAVSIAAALASTGEGSGLLLDAVDAGRASPETLREQVVILRVQASLGRSGLERIERLTANLPPADERLRQLVEQRRAGFQQASVDWEQGKRLFTKACAVCHRLGGEGKKIGPDLDGIGLRGLDRLLEDVLEPSRNVDQAFRTTIVETSMGKVITGLALGEEGEVLVLVDSQGMETRLAVKDIREKSVTGLSPMPANVADVVTEGDFYSLIGWLLRQREGGTSP